MIDRRTFVFIFALAASCGAAGEAFAKDSDGGGGGDSDGGDRDSDDRDDDDSDGGDKDSDKGKKRGRGDEDRIRDAVSSGDAIPLSVILKKVSRSYPGEVLRVRLKGKNEDLHYRIRILHPGGRRIDIDVDARTGHIIKADGD